MLNLWYLIKNNRAVQTLIGLGLSFMAALALIKKGESINQAKVDEEIRKRDSATRERRDKANEKINSSDSSVNDWLRDNNRFRD